MSEQAIATLNDVQAAAARIKPHIVTTPLLEAPLLSERLGFRLWVKAECLQLTGSFKVRGAFNHILQLSDDEKRRGVVAISSGNHAQAVAFAARKFSIAATIVMPQDAPPLKLANTRAYGADIVTYNRAADNRETIGHELAEKQGMTLIHPYDAVKTIAGQGTAGLEIAEQMGERGLAPNAVIAACSGGGLAGGIALTRELYEHPPQVFTAEPTDFDDARRSLVTGEMQHNDRAAGSICDALLSSKLGSHDLPVLLQQQVQGLAATDDTATAAMYIAAQYFKLVLEPGGAIALACALGNRRKFTGKNVVIVASGGNVDPDDYAKFLVRGKAQRDLLFAGL